MTLLIFLPARADEHGMNFIKEVAPFTVIVNALSNKDDVLNKCEEIYSYLKNNNVEVIYNDKNDSLKNKLYYANLLGFPFQINIGNRSIKNNKFEFITRNNMKSEEYDFNKLNTLLTVLQ